MPTAAGGVCSDPASRLPGSRRCAATLRMRRRGHLGQENPLSSSPEPRVGRTPELSVWRGDQPSRACHPGLSPKLVLPSLLSRRRNYQHRDEGAFTEPQDGAASRISGSGPVLPLLGQATPPPKTLCKGRYTESRLSACGVSVCKWVVGDTKWVVQGALEHGSPKYGLQSQALWVPILGPPRMDCCDLV